MGVNLSHITHDRILGVGYGVWGVGYGGKRAILGSYVLNGACLEKTTLINSLNDPEVIVRSEVVEALGGLRYKPAIARIQHTLRHDTEPLVRASAAEALGDIGDEQALTALEDALKDADEAVRSYAANSLYPPPQDLFSSP
jgi:hypothetical protein